MLDLKTWSKFSAHITGLFSPPNFIMKYSIRCSLQFLTLYTHGDRHSKVVPLGYVHNILLRPS